jgi:hypothetical protein
MAAMSIQFRKEPVDTTRRLGKVVVDWRKEPVDTTRRLSKFVVDWRKEPVDTTRRLGKFVVDWRKEPVDTTRRLSKVVVDWLIPRYSFRRFRLHQRYPQNVGYELKSLRLIGLPCDVFG